jgi:hypothetical protein
MGIVSRVMIISSIYDIYAAQSGEIVRGPGQPQLGRVRAEVNHEGGFKGL